MHALRTSQAFLLLLAMVLVGCAPIAAPTSETGNQPAISDTASSDAPTANLPGCVESYDPAVDYFPEKVKALYTVQWSVTYHNHYKVITVDSAYDDPATPAAVERYVLVQCGTPIPEELAAAEDTLVIEVPVRRLIEAGGGVLGAVEMLDLLEPLVAWRDQYTTGVAHLPKISAKYAAGELGDIGEYGSGWEATLNFEPELLIAYDDRETIEDARSLGVPYVFFSPFSEGPLGSAEQLKFVSLFFNVEAEANDLFTPIAEEYSRLRDLAQAQPEKPAVLLGNINSQGAFNTRPYNRIESILIEDAGGERVLGEELYDYSGFFPSVSLEVALELGAEADYWFSMAYLPTEETAADFIATDPLNGEFQALPAGNMFHRFGRDEDYFRTPAIRVDELLADMVSILYNSYWEPPLGSAEEIKLVSLFFNRETRANELLAPVIQNYLALKERVEAETTARPTVLFGNINNDGLFSSQPPNRIDIRLLQDAGTVPILQETLTDQPFDAIPLEVAVEIGGTADFWIDTTYFADTRLGNTVAGSLAYQPLNSSFDALAQGRAVHQFRRGTDIFATGQSYRVDLLLRELVSIFHPELLPDHTLTWFTVLEP